MWFGSVELILQRFRRPGGWACSHRRWPTQTALIGAIERLIGHFLGSSRLIEKHFSSSYLGHNQCRQQSFGNRMQIGGVEAPDARRIFGFWLRLCVCVCVVAAPHQNRKVVP